MKRKGVSIGRDGSRESFYRKPRDSAAGTRTRGKRRESLLRASTVADEIICGIRSLWKRVSMGSCEIPGVLTRAIYHARSVFAYVVKGPRRLCRGHRVVECLLKFACLRILLPALLLFTPLYLRISLFHYASAFSLYVTHRHPLRCEKRPLHRTYYEFSIVLRNFVSLISANTFLTDTCTLHRIGYLTCEDHW